MSDSFYPSEFCVRSTWFCKVKITARIAKYSQIYQLYIFTLANVILGVFITNFKSNPLYTSVCIDCAVSLQNEEYTLQNVAKVKKKQITNCVIVVNFVLAESGFRGVVFGCLNFGALYSVAFPQRIS